VALGREDLPVEFEEYVAQRYRSLCRFAGVLSGDPVLAEEVVADALATAFEQWDRIRCADSPHAYVRKMVLNEYLRWRRRSARMAVRRDVAELLAPVADHADAHADQQRLLVEMRGLPAKQRAAIVLRYYEELSFAEIADLLGSGENAVRSNISRGLRTLRVQLADDPGVASFPDQPIAVEARS
jgi:RNA polymerase sigma-70 factor (sigma-E family)